MFHFHSLSVEISSFESETTISKSSKLGKEQDINFGANYRDVSVQNHYLFEH